MTCKCQAESLDDPGHFYDCKIHHCDMHRGMEESAKIKELEAEVLRWKEIVYQLRGEIYLVSKAVGQILRSHPESSWGFHRGVEGGSPHDHREVVG